MDKQCLMEYQKLKREQGMLARQIDALEERNAPVVVGKVKASSREFPYTEQWVSVQMNEPVAAARMKRMRQIYKERQERVEQQLLRIEEFIDGIRDAETRQIFELRFIEGRKQKQIAEIMNLERSSISKKITNYLQVSPNSQKSVL